MTEVALLTTSLLFGGMLLYAFGFAAFVFTALPADTAGPLIRKAFPHFYLFVFLTSLAAGALAWFEDLTSASVLALIAVSTVFARQVLMPAINAATDSGDKSRFKVLHSLSVAITLAHIAGAGFVILRIAAL